ncbi:1,2-phenylacetyl-CoA epoxidase subunit PaaC [Pseudogracilibacillus sp. SE30717A]|uniref:1,2-phenylacetyl-CoA epoxidase subunit PaaC n=1 Tax=Pseudogracilibacillus sp. SE30717A TaxID=3098293 RepID=UPI00300E1DCD
MSKIIKTPEEAKQNQSYKAALVELLYQFADDDFIISFRGSEWLGLAPHIEEDVAFSSITQNTMGHATMFFQMLEELGEGDADHLAHGRSPGERRSSVYLEKMNGSGSYIEDANYDWALAVVRNFLYETLKRVKLEAATRSSYEPLIFIARKILMEQTYHLAHWRLWIQQLQASTEEAKAKISARLEEAWQEFGDAIELGPKADDIHRFDLLIDEETLKKRWLEKVNEVLAEKYESLPKKKLGNGRIGEFNADLEQAIDIFTAVYRTDVEAAW